MVRSMSWGRHGTHKALASSGQVEGDTVPIRTALDEQFCLMDRVPTMVDISLSVANAMDLLAFHPKQIKDYYSQGLIFNEWEYVH